MLFNVTIEGPRASLTFGIEGDGSHNLTENDVIAFRKANEFGPEAGASLLDTLMALEVHVDQAFELDGQIDTDEDDDYDDEDYLEESEDEDEDEDDLDEEDDLEDEDDEDE